MIGMKRLPSSLRIFVRRTLRLALRVMPVSVRRLAARVPFSRLHWSLPVIFWGSEKITWRGVRMIVNPGEVHGYYPYFLGDYAGDEIDLLCRLIRDESVFADVGANIGMIALAVAHSSPETQIYAFEPDPAIAARLRANVLLNPAYKETIRVVEKAVSNVDGEVQFESSAGTANAEVGKVVGTGSMLGITVEATRFDTFFTSASRFPNVVKIDVEGAELEVLQAMHGLGREHLPEHIVVEVHGFHHAIVERSRFKLAVAKILTDYGYELHALDGSPAPPASTWPDRIHIHAQLSSQIQ